MAIATPLRYPGGKSVMTKFLENFITANNMTNVCYAEPFAGGSGAALNLLTNRSVSRILINDASIPLYSFWESIVNHSDEFLLLFDNTPINIEEWERQRNIFFNHGAEFSVELGFATFYLNRCNRSGILKAGAIGGNSAEKQERAKYKIDARFNKESLRPKLEAIINLRDSITISNLDAIDFLEQCQNLNDEVKENLLIYLDPPYYVHGSELYMNSYIHDDHQALADKLRATNILKWILSYDNVDEIKNIYQDFDLYTFNLKYTVQIAKTGKELLTYSYNSILPENREIPRATHPIPLIRI